MSFKVYTCINCLTCSVLNCLFFTFNYSKQTNRDIHVDNVHPISRESVMSVANVYESIPLEHFSHDDITEEDEEGRMYVDLPENVYDRSFVKRTRVNGNTKFYALIAELKNRKD